MHANTAVGEVMLTIDDRDYIFRPSFLAISKIGSKDVLEGVANAVFIACSKIKNQINDISVLDIATALFVLKCCCDDDIEELGHIVGSKNKKKLLFKQKRVSINDIFVIADLLLRRGINGVETKRTKHANRFQSKNTKFAFDSAEFVASAVAHLKIPPDTAWQMTMPEYQLAIDAKYPQKEKDHPTQDQAEKTAELSRQALARLAESRKNKDKKNIKIGRA